MTRPTFTKLFILTLLFSFTLTLNADVYQKSSSEFKIQGTAGKILKFLGLGKKTYSAEYLKGNVYRSDKFDKKGKKVESSQFIFLDKELIVNVNWKKKKYNQMTFEEWREMIRAAVGQWTNPQPADGERPEGETPEVELQFSVDFEYPGDTKNFDKYSGEHVIMNLNLEAEAEDQESGETAKGGMKIKADNWLVKGIDNKELQEFHLRLAEKMGMAVEKDQLLQIVEQLKESNPQLAAAIQKYQEERENLEGMAFEVHTSFITWGAPPEKKEDGDAIPKSVGGLFKKFGKKDDPNKPKTQMEIFHKVHEFEEGVELEASLFEIPNNFKEEDKKRAY